MQQFAHAVVKLPWTIGHSTRGSALAIQFPPQAMSMTVPNILRQQLGFPSAAQQASGQAERPHFRMLPGSVRNWWAGLEAITLLFIKEHNYLCGELRKVGAPPACLPLWCIIGCDHFLAPAKHAPQTLLEWSNALQHPDSALCSKHSLAHLLL